MKQQTFILPEAGHLRNVTINLIESRLHSLPDDQRTEVVFRNARRSKTMEQLGALFGVWVKYLSSELGYTENELHRMMKAKCLARIYITEPVGSEQEAWVELLAIYQQNQDPRMPTHAKRIKLSWANLEQMKQYMKSVEEYWIGKGYPLPELKKKTGGEND